MKTKTWLAAIVAACVMLCACAQSAAAEQIGSNVSGVYAGPDRVCRIVVSRYQSLWVQSDARCIEFVSGAQTRATAMVWSPNACPTETWAIPLDQVAGYYGPHLSIRAITDGGASLSVVLGAGPNAAASGAGAAQTWYRLDALQSPAPYSCGGVISKPNDR